jgi:hypothetical protein
MERQAMSHQYLLPFEAARDEAMALVRCLRSACLEMTRGRAEGVAELLERLLLLSRDCTEYDGIIESKVQVMAIAARITARTTRSERTIQNWTRDCKELGILVVEYASQQYGGHNWNTYRINMLRLRELLNQGRSGVKRGETTSGLRPETTSGLRPETTSGLKQRSVQRRIPPPPMDTPPVATRPAAADSFDLISQEWDAVRDALHQSDIHRAEIAIRLAKDQGMPPAQVLEIVGQYAQNKSRFRSPGAIVDRIRNGSWPVALPTQESIDAARQSTQQSQAKKDREREFYRLCRQWQAEKVWHMKTNEEIEAELDRRMASDRVAVSN